MEQPADSQFTLYYNRHSNRIAGSQLLKLHQAQICFVLISWRRGGVYATSGIDASPAPLTGSVHRFCSRRISSQNPSATAFSHGKFVYHFSAYRNAPAHSASSLCLIPLRLHDNFQCSWFCILQAPKSAHFNLI